MLLSLLTILISSPVQAIGSQLDPNDNNFTINNEYVVATNSVSGSEIILSTTPIQYVQQLISPENIQNLLSGQNYLLRIDVHDDQGRLNGKPNDNTKIGVRVGVINASCMGQSLSGPDDSCWIHQGVNGVTNGYNPDNLRAMGNGCVVTTGGVSGKNMTCYTKNIFTGNTDFGDFRIVGLISQQKYCEALASKCHNNGDPFTEDGKVEDCINNLCTICTPKEKSTPSTSYTCHNTTHRNLTKTFTYDVSCQGVSNTYTSDNPISCGVGKVCSSSNTCVTPNSDCTSNGACDEEETCSSDSHCAGTLECDSGANKCREADDCRSDNTCTSGETCDETPDCAGNLKCSGSDNECTTHSESTCASTGTCGEGKTCTSSGNECEAGYGCDADSNKCVKINDCRWNNNCNSGSSDTCYHSNDCGSLTCNSGNCQTSGGGGGDDGTCQVNQNCVNGYSQVQQRYRGCGTGIIDTCSSSEVCRKFSTNDARCVSPYVNKGAYCSHDRQCKNSLQCTSGTCGTCTQSATCNGNTATITNTKCQTLPPRNCGSGDYCQSGDGGGCKDKKDDGQSCSTDPECESGTCGDNSNICIKAGGQCGGPSDCPSNKKACINYECEDCSQDSHCASDEQCTNNRCRALNCKVGEYCPTSTQHSLGYIENHKCKKTPSISCPSSARYCSEDGDEAVCSSRLPRGHFCLYNFQCYSYHCHLRLNSPNSCS